MGLDAETEQSGIAVERFPLGRYGQLGKLIGTEYRIVGHPGLHPTADHFERVAHRDGGQNLNGLGQGRPLDDAAGMDGDCLHGGK